VIDVYAEEDHGESTVKRMTLAGKEEKGEIGFSLPSRRLTARKPAVCFSRLTGREHANLPSDHARRLALG
jgi:hypothetical protein